MPALTLITRYTNLRARILERVRRVNQLTETASLEAGSSLQHVVTTAKNHIAQLSTLLVRSTDSTLQEAIARHAAHVREHALALSQAVDAHAVEMAQVAQDVDRIKAAAKEVERANVAARILSMNARIEAFRSDAPVFKAIATEMNDLSRNVTSANKHIQGLANTMAASLPKLIGQSEALRNMASAFMAETHEQISHVDEEVAALKSSVEGTLRSSDESLAMIIAASHEALTALQNQDVCAQSLLQLDAWQAEVLRDAVRALRVEIDVAPDIDGVSRDADILDPVPKTGEVVLF